MEACEIAGFIARQPSLDPRCGVEPHGLKSSPSSLDERPIGGRHLWRTGVVQKSPRDEEVTFITRELPPQSFAECGALRPDPCPPDEPHLSDPQGEMSTSSLSHYPTH